MAKKVAEPDSESSLCPPPTDLALTVTETTAGLPTRTNKRKGAAGAKATKRLKKDVHDDDEDGELPLSVPASSRSKRRATKEVYVEEEITDDEVKVEEHENGNVKAQKPTTRKSKGGSKSAKTPEAYAERTKDSKLRMGAHVSTAGGVQNAIPNLVSIGANAFAMFLKSQRKWENPALDPKNAQLFVDGCKEHNINPADCCVPHGSYLVNLAHPDPARKKQAYDCFHDDLVRCHKLGIKLYNFHPGNANATTREEGIKIIAQNLNEAHQDPATGEVITVLETMASLGNTIGGTFADLAAIIEQVKDKSRVAVCLDTCHVFAAGYDLRSPEAYAATMNEFDEVIGLQYLRAFHINDSKAPLRSHRDLHARIGTGYLGLRSFHNLMNDERFHGLPMVLETPISVTGADGKKIEDKGIWAKEIKLLESLVGMDATTEEFEDLEAKLQDDGKDERERIGGQVDRKKVKDEKPKKKRGKKKIDSDEDEDDFDE